MRYALLGLVLFLSICQLDAQNRVYSGFTLKKLLIDYQTPNNGTAFDFQNWHGGYELGYYGRINDRWSVVVPWKVAVIKQYKESNLDMLMMGLDIQAQYAFLGNGRTVNPYFAGGVGFVSEDLDSMHAEIPLGFGVNFGLAPNADINLELSYRFGLKEDKDNLHLGIGFNYRFGPKIEMNTMKTESDRDMDGIIDVEDLCPDMPGTLEFFGCPDTDEDGISDNLDACPEVFGDPQFAGCPDRDGDGISDLEDNCPDEVGTIANAGCPEIVRVDTDKDGVYDDEDDCPYRAGDINNRGCPRISDRDGDGVEDSQDYCPDAYGLISLNGCPDRDGDGIRDNLDRCPDEKGVADNYGCPGISREDRDVLQFAVNDIEFDFAKATLRPNSFPILDKVADIMRKYPTYKLRIGGYTDNVGSASRNQILSERRARSCYEYLASKGIPTSRMKYVGFGEKNPIATNDTEVGRAKNRRVEFDLEL